MSIFLGSTAIGNVYRKDTPILRIYKGTTLVYQAYRHVTLTVNSSSSQTIFAELYNNYESIKHITWSWRIGSSTLNPAYETKGKFVRDTSTYWEYNAIRHKMHGPGGTLTVDYDIPV